MTRLRQRLRRLWWEVDPRFRWVYRGEEDRSRLELLVGWRSIPLTGFWFRGWW